MDTMKFAPPPYSGILLLIDYSDLIINDEKWKIRAITGKTGRAPYASSTNTTVIIDKDMYRGFELIKQ